MNGTGKVNGAVVGSCQALAGTVEISFPLRIWFCNIILLPDVKEKGRAKNTYIK